MWKLKSWLFLYLYFAAQFCYAFPSELLNVSMQQQPDKTHIVFLLNKKTKGKVIYLSEQRQLKIQFFNTINKAFMPNELSQDQQAENLIVTLNLPDKFKYQTTYRSYGDKAELELNLSKIAIQKPIIKKKRVFTIVIDAGHGGHDTGAIGRGGIYEKNIVLGISKYLAAYINQSKNMHALMTRSGDYYVNLRQRLKLARKEDADLFIAIHADAHYDKAAKGASVYALSQHGATTEAARWLAQKENYSEIGDVEFNALQDRSPVLRSVLIDMSQTVTVQDSMRLGTNMLGALKRVTSLHYRRVERAPFVVLKSPDIPSVLIETGFISNPKEENRLADPQYQRLLAKAIYNGLQIYNR